MVVTKYTDIKNQLKDVVSRDSQSSGRVIINENFHLLNSTISSIWDVINAIYDPATEKILTLALMADVKVTGGDAPNVGDSLVWKGGYWGPAPVGVGGNGAQFLTQLQDVVTYTYPIANKSILQYDIFANKFGPVLNDIFALANSTVISGTATPSILAKNVGDQFVAIDAGAVGTFLKSAGASIGFSYITLADIDDVIAPPTPIIGQQYVFQYTGGGDYQMQAVPSLNSGTKFIIGIGEVVQVFLEYQYIVHEHLYLDGSIEIDGELVIL